MICCYSCHYRCCHINGGVIITGSPGAEQEPLSNSQCHHPHLCTSDRGTSKCLSQFHLDLIPVPCPTMINTLFFLFTAPLKKDLIFLFLRGLLRLLDLSNLAQDEFTHSPFEQRLAGDYYDDMTSLQYYFYYWFGTIPSPNKTLYKNWKNCSSRTTVYLIPCKTIP